MEIMLQLIFINITTRHTSIFLYFYVRSIEVINPMISMYVMQSFFSWVLSNGSVFGKRDLLAIDYIMLALFWSYVPNIK